jgi:hypothetical protein
LREGFLRRCDESEAILSLLRVIANTPHGSWEGGRHFGLRELLDESRARPDRVQVAVEEMNLSLDSLGITNFRVESIQCESAPADEASRWVVTLVSTVDRTKTYSLAWSVRTE